MGVLQSVKTGKKTVQDKVNLIARLRDCKGKDGGTNCISCGYYYPFDELEGGHFIPQGTSGAIRFDLRNINAQCHTCNFHRHGNSRHYYHGMIKKYGKKVTQEIEALEGVTKKWKLWELQELNDILDKRLEEEN